MYLYISIYLVHLHVYTYIQCIYLYKSIYFRLEKCEICYSHLQQIRHDIYNTPQTNPAHSLVTRISTKLKLNEAFSLLD